MSRIDNVLCRGPLESSADIPVKQEKLFMSTCWDVFEFESNGRRAPVGRLYNAEK